MLQDQNTGLFLFQIYHLIKKNKVKRAKEARLKSILPSEMTFLSNSSSQNRKERPSRSKINGF